MRLKFPPLPPCDWRHRMKSLRAASSSSSQGSPAWRNSASAVGGEGQEGEKLLPAIAEHPEESRDPSIEVVVDLDRGRLLVEQDGGRPAEGLDVGMMGREEGGDPPGEIIFAAVPLHGRPQVRRQFGVPRQGCRSQTLLGQVRNPLSAIAVHQASAGADRDSRSGLRVVRFINLYMWLRPVLLLSEEGRVLVGSRRRLCPRVLPADWGKTSPASWHEAPHPQ